MQMLGRLLESLGKRTRNERIGEKLPLFHIPRMVSDKRLHALVREGMHAS